MSPPRASRSRPGVPARARNRRAARRRRRRARVRAAASPRRRARTRPGRQPVALRAGATSASWRSIDGSPTQTSPQSMTPLTRPSATSTCRTWKSPCTSAYAELGGSRSASRKLRSAARDSSRVRSASAASRSRVLGTRTAMSARPFGSSGRRRSGSVTAGTSRACNARRNPATCAPTPSRARSESSASASSQPGSSGAPKNGRGNSSLGSPSSAGAGTGNR